MTITRSLGAALCLGLGLASIAQAAEPGFYVGGGLGQSDFSGDIAQQIARTYAGDDALSLDAAAVADDSDSAYKLFAGYRFGSWFGVEFAWHDLGEARTVYEVSPITPVSPPPPGVTIEGRYDLSGPALTVFGEWDFTDSVSGIVRAGVFNAELDYDEVGIAGAPHAFSNSGSDTRPTFGLGLNWRVSSAWDLRLDYDRFNGVGERFAFTDDGNGRFDHVDVLSLNLAYRFSN
jgi:OOP family OmpA-OmpF porin